MPSAAPSARVSDFRLDPDVRWRRRCARGSRRPAKTPGIQGCQQENRFVNLYSNSEKGVRCQALIGARDSGGERRPGAASALVGAPGRQVRIMSGEWVSGSIAQREVSHSGCRRAHDGLDFS